MYASMLTIATLSVLSTVFAQPGTEDFIHLETLWNAAHRTADAEALVFGEGDGSPTPGRSPSR